MFLIFLLALNSLFADMPATKEAPVLVENEIDVLNTLINATEKNLATQKKMKGLVLDYQTALAFYLKNSSDKEAVIKVALVAEKLLSEIQKSHLTDSFNPDFISELTLFSQIAAKKGIPRPV